MGYSKSLSKSLASAGAEEGSVLEVESNGKSYKGTLMPHHDFSAEDVIVIKLKSGYNIGVRISDNSTIKVVAKPSPKERKPEPFTEKPGLPKIVLMGTGGTIASYVDYRTGAVHPALSASDMVNAVPETKEVANMYARVLFSIFSENMTPDHWKQIAAAVKEEIDNCADAIVIPHGTDTMGYTAAALSFMLGDLSKPVVLVGAQRSSDRPSSDASSNLLAAVKFCASGNRAGVFVVMHEGLGDDSFAVHLGTRVRKMHTSRRDAFHSINVPPAAIMDKAGNITFSGEGKAVGKGKIELKTDMEKSTILLQFYPGMDPALFEGPMMKSKGIVISGSGLGHVNENMVPLIKKACDNGSVVVITSQCLGGRTNLNVYNTGRDMIEAGAISVSDMLPETAYVKLMWALANSKNAEAAKMIMQTPLAGEMGNRRVVDG